MNTSLVRSLSERVTALALNVDAPFDDLEPLTRRVRDARVVALGSAVRTSHELSTLTSRVMRFLVHQHGYRALALEGDGTASANLDIYVRTGEGDPRTILAGARNFLRFAELVEAIRWIRAYNERN